MSTDRVRVKICGLTNEDDLAAAIEAGADYVGFVSFAKSPRHVDVARARALALATPAGVCRVGLFVNPSDNDLDAMLDQVPLDMIQLHGSETPERVTEIKTQTGLPVMKSVGISTANDLAQIGQYAGVADQLLIDAKPAPSDTLPGGNGVRFDWRLIAGRKWFVPWMLAGGLTPDNVAEAVRLTGATQVDVSSGVEAAPGRKDPARIRALIAAARAA